MLDILELFGLSTLMAIVISIPVALSGPHYCARGKYLELLPMTQIAYFIFHVMALITLDFELPQFILFFIQITASLAAMRGAQKFFKGDELRILAAYLFFMTSDYALLTLFPKIDGHLSSHLFGDIVTVGGLLGVISTFICVGLSLMQILNHKKYLRETLDQCLYQSKSKTSLFEWVSLASIVLCLYNLGPVLTLAILIFPSLLLTDAIRGHRAMLFTSLFSLIISSVFGMLTTSLIDRLPSVSVVTLTYGLMLLILGGLVKTHQARRIMNA